MFNVFYKNIVCVRVCARVCMHQSVRSHVMQYGLSSDLSYYQMCNTFSTI